MDLRFPFGVDPMTGHRFCLAAIVAVWLLPWSAWSAQRNVVLFVTDDQGPDAGCYGNPVLKTPHLDALARDGTLFTYAFCTTASCSASRSVILTGLHNHANGQYGHTHHYHKFNSYTNLSSLPIYLAQAGFRTARCGKYHVAPAHVYRFETAIGGAPRNPVEMANRCQPFIEQASNRPFFLYFCTSDPHRSGDRANCLTSRIVLAIRGQKVRVIRVFMKKFTIRRKSSFRGFFLILRSAEQKSRSIINRSRASIRGLDACWRFFVQPTSGTTPCSSIFPTMESRCPVLRQPYTKGACVRRASSAVPGRDGAAS